MFFAEYKFKGKKPSDVVINKEDKTKISITKQVGNFQIINDFLVQE